MRPFLIVGIAGTALAVMSCSSSPDTNDINDVPAEETISGALTAAQITSLISGNTAYGQEAKYQWRTYYAKNGMLMGRIWGSFGEEHDHGTWQVTAKDNQLCRQWTVKWGDLKRACFELFKDGEQIKLINVDGNDDSYEMMIVSGNKVEG